MNLHDDDLDFDETAGKNNVMEEKISLKEFPQPSAPVLSPMPDQGSLDLL